MKRLLHTLFVAAGALALAAAAHAAPVLAGHSGLNGQNLDAEAAKSVLLGKRVTIGNARVVIVIAKASAAQDAFLQSHVGMNTSQFQNHWRRLFMTGGGSAPKIVETEAEACKTAAETPGAVVVADSAAAAGLAVLAN
ncbi:hypothetical protein [Opitutus terrae]|uniref:Uncharacterized protein n=1 Tax=Opitutus terrae (strain DSM 11246 / JCM 15787 / PB90-1) TaxID=452637 RepID=B1ZTF5_OPITP|nr:hypothetical protein [Opitutus terrae]ACB73900.1 hypothetical protein Oter_0610 [Opitutus terrae PB90-1]